MLKNKLSIGMPSILYSNNIPTHAVKGPGIIGNILPAMPSKAKKRPKANNIVFNWDSFKNNIQNE